ncbi:MAG: hypothetical protein WA823_13950 [Candidatus Acidiferrales bacterium]
MISASRLQRVIAVVLGFAILLFIGDYLVLKIRASTGNGSSAFGSISIIQGTPMKDGRVQIFTTDAQSETCVHSLFPHLGYRPCWYVKQNQMQLIGAWDRQPVHRSPTVAASDIKSTFVSTRL